MAIQFCLREPRLHLRATQSSEYPGRMKIGLRVRYNNYYVECGRGGSGDSSSYGPVFPTFAILVKSVLRTARPLLRGGDRRFCKASKKLSSIPNPPSPSEGRSFVSQKEPYARNHLPCARLFGRQAFAIPTCSTAARASSRSESKRFA